jgi:hypothetical protein
MATNEFLIIQTVILLTSWFVTAYKMFSQFATKKDLEALENRLTEKLQDKIELSSVNLHRRINGLYTKRKKRKKDFFNPHT